MATFLGIFQRWPLVSKLTNLVFLFDSRLDDFSSEYINNGIKKYEARGGQADPDRAAPDMLTKLLDITAKDENRGESSMIVQGAAASNVFAGSDTTGISLTSIFFQLMKHPDKLAKLQQELDTAAFQGQVSEPITFAQSQKLPYLQAVIKEALRLHPATGLPMWRQVPKEGAVVCGQYFPAGANLGINSWVAHSNEDIFPDARAFLPERWIDSSKKALSEMERYFMSFGMGARACIGRNISLLEMNKVVPELLRRYDFKMADPQVERLDSLNRWFVKQHNLKVRVSKRA